MKTTGRRVSLVYKCVYLVGVIWILTGCSSNMDTQSKQVAESKENVMKLAYQTDKDTFEIPPIDAAAPMRFETASFGLGWFWGIESQFGIIEGIIRTRVGYAGGRKDAPTYRNMGDHTETVQVDYDPERISYRQLLDIFWKSHNPVSGRWSRQYMNAVFYHNEEQRQAAMSSKDEVARKADRPVKTEVVSLRSFTMAEDYHQKYILKGRDILKQEISRIYPNHQDLVSSTAASRLNGYAGGNGSRNQLEREIESLGLSIKGKQALLEMVRK